MAARAKTEAPPDPGDLSCLAQRLTAVLVTLQEATDVEGDLLDRLKAHHEDLPYALLCELFPVAIRMSRELETGLDLQTQQPPIAPTPALKPHARTDRRRAA
ncbi:MAG: hypothetical protein Q7W02_02350 [Candidatus Rokubacteria bacterium]|nr:hypothetical protein [Candidatus Rokubacteria bacterium]